jgi:hypothetical protein
MKVLLTNSEEAADTWLRAETSDYREWVVLAPGFTPPTTQMPAFNPDTDRFVWIFDSTEPFTDNYTDAVAHLSLRNYPFGTPV